MQPQDNNPNFAADPNNQPLQPQQPTAQPAENYQYPAPVPFPPASTQPGQAYQQQPPQQPTYPQAPIQPQYQQPQYPPQTQPYGQPNPQQQPQNPLLPDQQQHLTPAQMHTPDQGRHLLSSTGKKYFKLIEFDSQEELLLEIRKHSFGLFIIVAGGIFVALAIFMASVLVAATGFLASVGLGAGGTGNSIFALFGFLVAVIVLIVMAINAQLYTHNVVFITNQKVAQVVYVTLFNRKVSQLNIGDVQDVSVHQDGFFPRAFKYGTLIIETAGEQQNYTFSFVPNPHEASHIIIDAHEHSIKKYGN